MSYNKLSKEPKIDWEEKKYDMSTIESLDVGDKHERRERAKIETARDFDKNVEQLVCDVHDEILNPVRSPEQNIAGAQQRMVTMMAKIAESNNKTNKWLVRLTILIALFTIIQILINLC